MEQEKKAQMFDAAVACYQTLIRPHLVKMTESTTTPFDDYIVRALDFILRYRKEGD